RPGVAGAREEDEVAVGVRGGERVVVDLRLEVRVGVVHLAAGAAVRPDVGRGGRDVLLAAVELDAVDAVALDEGGDRVAPPGARGGAGHVEDEARAADVGAVRREDGPVEVVDAGRDAEGLVHGDVVDTSAFIATPSRSAGGPASSVSRQRQWRKAHAGGTKGRPVRRAYSSRMVACSGPTKTWKRSRRLSGVTPVSKRKASARGSDLATSKRPTVVPATASP